MEDHFIKLVPCFANRIDWFVFCMQYFIERVPSMCMESMIKIAKYAYEKKRQCSEKDLICNCWLP